MKNSLLAILLLTGSVTIASPNIVPLNQLMFYTIVENNALQILEDAYPEYAEWLSDTDVLLLLNAIHTAQKPVLVKFAADWCTPCNRLKPIVDEAAQEMGNAVLFIEINLDDYPVLREMFHIDVVPTLLYFKNGKLVDRTNSVSKATLLTKIQTLIDRKNNAVPH